MMKLENVCRLCAKEKPLKYLEHTIDDPILNIEQKLIDCCRWNLLASNECDGMPKTVCATCYRQLESSWAFSESVADAQRQLYSLVGNNQKPMPTVIEYVNASEKEPIVKDEPSETIDSYLNDIENDWKDANQASEEQPIPYTLNGTTEPHVKVEEIKVSLMTPDIDSSSDEDVTPSPLLEDDMDVFEQNDDESDDAPTSKKKPKKRYDSKGIDFNEIQRKRLQKLPGSLSRLCDTCGKEFSSQTSLRRHRLMHSGDQYKSFICKTCGKGFRDNYNLKVSLSR